MASSYNQQSESQGPFEDTPAEYNEYRGSPSTSASLYSTPDQRPLKNDLAVETIAAHLYNRALDNQWFTHSTTLSGVAIKKPTYNNSGSQYLTMPDDSVQGGLFQIIASFLRCNVAMIISSDVVSSLTSKMVKDTAEIPLSLNDGTQALRIQVLERLQEYTQLRRSQKAAFFRSEGLLLIWDSNVVSLEEEGLDLEERMVSFIWKTAAPKMNVVSEQDRTIKLWKREQAQEKEKQIAQFHASLPANLTEDIQTLEYSSSSKPSNPTFGRQIQEEKIDFNQDEEQKDESDLYIRSTVPLACIHSALSVVVCIIVLGMIGGGSCISYFLKSGDAMSLLLLIALPFLFCVSLFPSSSVVSCVLLLIGPISPMHRNTRYFSAKPVKRLTQNLPHITIQMPVYKEDLNSVIAPTIESLSKAIRTYELQGGSASILVSEDGLALLPKAECKARIDYYESMDVNWVARPKHGETYIRKGRFKKASNLNFTCQLSMKVDNYIQDIIDQSETELSAQQVKMLAEECVYNMAKELHVEAEAKGDVRIGDLILLVDSDTRIPEDSLLDSASEMARCPDVAVLQHASGVLLSDKPNYFEKGIAFFTEVVNWSITFSISYGQVPPFMGHNAFLRWSALQEVAENEVEEDGNQHLRVWADNMVSEDFDMALRLVSKGYTLRWATYSEGGFQEGVSLTHIDELNRWQKYAFGASEIVFNPFRYWFKRGPLAKTFRQFLWSNCPIFYKFAALSYIFSYYGMACGLPMTVALSLIGGWYDEDLLPFFQGATPFKMFVFIAVLYIVINPLCLAIGQARSRSKPPFKALIDFVKWTPYFLAFFASMSYHISTALLSHILSINMSWSATVKEVGESHIFIELPLIFKRFWRTYLICLVVIGGFAVLSTSVLPYQWQIYSFTYIVPPLFTCSCESIIPQQSQRTLTYLVPTSFPCTVHILGPLLLDPALLRFSF